MRASCTIAWSDQNSHRIDQLTPDERREYDGLPHDARRRDWLAGRQAAKHAIAAHCGVPGTDVRLVQQIGAAPAVRLRVDDVRPSPLSLSISHHRGRGLAAVADSPTRIGVDLERVGEIEPEHHRYFLAPSEHAVAERDGPTLVWTLKEAAWKALSLTSATPFSALRLLIDEASELRGLWFSDAWMPATARTWRLSHDIIAAVVCVGAEWQ
jgi:4'-phosphopantetheinyl transferase EntD